MSEDENKVAHLAGDEFNNLNDKECEEADVCCPAGNEPHLHINREEAEATL